ncbi:ABC transporter ATP-binding protein [Nocardioides yefusunii]|uniref:ABC transporter ATP-binding protein n=1 Tax=Nocardioides yefusunii TaxID=2500546 RepID=A0ABW1QY96_9ACTN|nr:ATP-binding cassette domain-containing protein [Nocardioides yefusunii]
MIKVQGLSKSYGQFQAVDDVTFTAQAGRVTGFLGPNGAGKSTVMRMMVGLTVPTSGTATIGGHRYADIPNPGRHVGLLLDASAQHGGRTGREVLTLSARTMGLPASRVDEMLELVGLSGSESKRRVKNYSLGMRQRLGIANALLGDPSVLILDEPANGLDPAGIHWMRGLLTGFAAEGGAVLLSSHLLNEVELIADEMILIGRGKIVAQGDKQSLANSAGGGPATLVAGEQPGALGDALTRAGLAFAPAGSGFRVQAQPIEVGRVAQQANLVLADLRPAEGGLEQLFLTLTADTQRDAPAGVSTSPSAPTQGAEA